MKKLSIVLYVTVIALAFLEISPVTASHTATVKWIKETGHPGRDTEYYWNGYTQKWINFSVRNDGGNAITRVEVILPKEAEKVLFYITDTIKPDGWESELDELDNYKRPQVIRFWTNDPAKGIKSGQTAEFKLFFKNGPKDECRYNVEIITHDSGKNAELHTHTLYILIDNHVPSIHIIKPDNGSVFQECEKVRIEAYAEDVDGKHPSKIKRVELWIGYKTKKGIIPPKYVADMNYDASRKIYWWETHDSYLKNEAWHIVITKAVDYAENTKNSSIMLFWYRPAKQIEVYTIDPCFLYGEPIGHVGSTVRTEVHTGFAPHCTVTCYFKDKEVCKAITDAYGQFKCEFEVPEVPRGTYKVKCTDGKTEVETNFRVIPWVWIDKTEGYVGETVTITGKGFKANEQVDVYYRDVSKNRIYWEWAEEWCGEAKRLRWYPHLDELRVGSKKTNLKGTFSLTFRVPRSYGGLHPIYAKERKSGIRSGWMPNYPQAACFKVLPKIWTDPRIGLSGQYIQVFGEGLPLPEYKAEIYDCKTGKTSMQEHNWYLVMDFGENKHWIFEKGSILNCEFDLAWELNVYLPFAFYRQHNNPHSPVWNGTLCWMDSQGQFHEGSPFLKVPALVPDKYNITLYNFDFKQNRDVYNYKAYSIFEVLKDPLNVRVTSGQLYFPNELVAIYVEFDLDGKVVDPSRFEAKLYHGDELFTELTLTKVQTGIYSASFICPSMGGNYFIVVHASITIDDITIMGVGTSSFTVSPTLEGFGAKLESISGDIAYVKTDLGTVLLKLTSLNASLLKVEESLATIRTDIGTIQTELSNINGKIEKVEGDVATVSTSLGKIKVELSDIGAKISSVDGKIVTIDTAIGTIQTDISNINGKIDKIEGDLVTISTSLGDIQSKLSDIDAKIISIDGRTVKVNTAIGDLKGTLETVHGKMITVDTNVGKITMKLDSIRAETRLQPTSIVLSSIAAVAAIIAAILTFRKIYK